MAEECTHNCSTCSSSCASADKKSLREAPNPLSSVKHIIAVVSGKGGVGKSMVTATLANRMAEKGFRVGILDADITGPSIPKMYGVHGSAVGSEAGMFPCVAKDGTKIMSVNLLLEHEHTTVPFHRSLHSRFWTRRLCFYTRTWTSSPEEIG